MSLEMKIILSAVTLVLFSFYLFSRKKIKYFIPLIFLGFILGPQCWNILDSSFKNFSMLYFLPAIFILGSQMGRGFDLDFWQNFPVESFFNDLIEKIILIFSFLAIFFLVIPSMMFIPDNFPYYFSIIAFTASFFFTFSHLIPKEIKSDILSYYLINHLIIILLFLLLYFFFQSPHQSILKMSLSDLTFYLFFFLAQLFILFKLKIDDTRTIYILLIGLILLGSVFSQAFGIFPLILGFLTGILSNYMPIKVQLGFKRIFYFFNEYLSPLFIVLAGFMMEISFYMILLGFLLFTLRFFSRFIIHSIQYKNVSFNDFIVKNAFFLLQGEYLIAFLILFSLEYQLNSAISLGLISLAFSDLLTYYYHHKFQKKTSSH